MTERGYQLFAAIALVSSFIVSLLAGLVAIVTLGPAPERLEPVAAWALLWGTWVTLLLLHAAVSFRRQRSDKQAVSDKLPEPAETQAPSAPAPISEQVRQQFKAIELAVSERRWARAEELLAQLEQLCQDPTTVRQARELIETERAEHVRELTEQLEAAKREANPHTVLDLRDRLVELLEATERRNLDEAVARWSLAYLREALHEGRTRELIDLIERMAETFGESTVEGMELKNALPILRRSAGRCPDCGQPYDISLERCPDCERKRRSRRQAIGSTEASDEPPGGNGQQVN